MVTGDSVLRDSTIIHSIASAELSRLMIFVERLALEGIGMSLNFAISMKREFFEAIQRIRVNVQTLDLRHITDGILLLGGFEVT